MNIRFFGSSLVSCYWNGAATYYRGLLRALADLGHDISFYEPDAFDRQRNRDIPDPSWARVVVYPATPDGWRRSLDEAVSDADLLVKASGVGVFDRELEIAVSESGSPRILTAYWDVDAPATLDAIAGDPNHHLRSAVPRFDAVFTYGGGDPVVQAYQRAGARLCVPIYNALDPQTHHPAPPRADYACDLGFLGNRLPDREARVEDFFLKAAALLPDRTFVLGGSGWETKPMTPNVRYVGHVGTAAHNAFFGSGIATLNINRASMASYGFSPPTRVFEAAGAGACLITDAWVGIELFLEPETEILVANDGAEVAAIIGSLAQDRAAAIGERALRRILAAHTYAHRARQVSAILETDFKDKVAA
jgi:spore maturation protein CgeB